MIPSREKFDQNPVETQRDCVEEFASVYDMPWREKFIKAMHKLDDMGELVEQIRRMKPSQY